MNKQQQKPQLPEERQFQIALRAGSLIAVTFVVAFAALTIVKARISPTDITANWFAAWGQWAGGLMTGAAFLIAAYSVAVSSAHARVDRENAARAQDSQDMAQARLLTMYRVETPTVPRSMVTYRIENRSNDIFFDVTVPYVERLGDSDGGFGRTTPADADTSLQYLPAQELLTPYRTSNEHEGWFTQVVVYTSDHDSVQFAVEYADAAGNQWKQHLGGKIERMFPTHAVPVRPADRFQPQSQIRLATPDEMPGGDPNRDWTQLDAITGPIASSWTPARRIGRPEISVLTDGPGRIAMTVSWTPLGPPPWSDAFREKLIETYPFTNSGSQGDVQHVYVECSDNDMQGVIAAVDDAIEHANAKFNETVITPLRAAQAQIAAEEAAAAEHRRQLEERAAQFEKPYPEHFRASPRRSP